MLSEASLRRNTEPRPKEAEMELCNYLKGRMSQTEGTASAKALRQVLVWHVCGTVRGSESMEDVGMRPE